MGKCSAKIIIAIVVILGVIQMIDGGILGNRQERAYKQYNTDPKKRPFCNAFTGCGKKRSESAAGQQANNAPQNENPLLADTNDDTLSTLLDLNSEPAVEDLMRQIMSEAKLWEAIQEAGREILLQKQQGKSASQLPISFSTQ